MWDDALILSLTLRASVYDDVKKTLAKKPFAGNQHVQKEHNVRLIYQLHLKKRCGSKIPLKRPCERRQKDSVLDTWSFNEGQ